MEELDELELHQTVEILLDSIHTRVQQIPTQFEPKIQLSQLSEIHESLSQNELVQYSPKLPEVIHCIEHTMHRASQTLLEQERLEHERRVLLEAPEHRVLPEEESVVVAEDLPPLPTSPTGTEAEMESVMEKSVMEKSVMEESVVEESVVEKSVMEA